MSDWPITYDDVLAARERLAPAPCADAAALVPRRSTRRSAAGSACSSSTRTSSRPARSRCATRSRALTALDAQAAPRAASSPRRAATTASASRGPGERLGVPVTVCVPLGNNPEKNAAMRALGARLIEEGRDYDESVQVAERLVRERGPARSCTRRTTARVVAGAGTLDARDARAGARARRARRLGRRRLAGGRRADGRARALRPGVRGLRRAGRGRLGDPRRVARGPAGLEAVRGHVRRRARDAQHLPVHVRRRCARASPASSRSATRRSPRRCACCSATTHTLVEGAGAAGLAGLLALRETLAGQTVAIVLSGANIDAVTLGRVLNREI